MTPNNALVTVQIATRSRGVPQATKLRRWARAAMGARGEVTLRVVASREARELNHRYRGRDYATNVLSFTLGEGSHAHGDVVICAPVVTREARAQGKTLDAHYAHLTVHGVLHLRGYDHEDNRGARRMENRERAILSALGYPDPYK